MAGFPFPPLCREKSLDGRLSENPFVWEKGLQHPFPCLRLGQVRAAPDNWSRDESLAGFKGWPLAIKHAYYGFTVMLREKNDSAVLCEEECGMNYIGYFDWILIIFIIIIFGDNQLYDLALTDAEIT